ncbi:MAG: iron ABC transporter permease [Planctomycetota bacterium]
MQLLPLAVPGYIAAYAMTDLLQFSGPVQGWLREMLGWSRGDYWFPEIRSLGGAIVVLGFSLYPYVFFAARSAFLSQPASVLEAGRTLGRGPLGTFWSIALPMARPAVAGAALLVVMETAADFGTADYCAVDTFSTGVYRTWFGLDSVVGASQLSSVLLAAVVSLLILETLGRRGRRYHETSARSRQAHCTTLGGPAGLLAACMCALPVVVGFVAPAGRLVWLAIDHGAEHRWTLLVEHAGRSVLLGGTSAVVAVMLAVVVIYSRRIDSGLTVRVAAMVARSGYAIPGPVLAIGLLASLGWIDHAINDASAAWRPDAARPGLILTGSIFAVLIGYQARFLAVGLAMVESGFARVNPRLDDTARSLGSTPLRTLARVHLPMIRFSLFAAGVLVFVDVVKELPATLMLRPFNFDTLAVRVYQLASDERLGEAAPAAIAIVFMGMLPVALLSRIMSTPSQAAAESRRGARDDR